MIAQEHRFHGRNSLKPVLARGQRVKTSFFAACYLPKRRRQPRLAIVVSKKVDKRAVVRNRIRRRLYAIARSEFLSRRPEVDLVIIVSDRQLADMDHNQLQSLLSGLWMKLAGR